MWARQALPPDAVAALAKREVPLAPGVVCREPVRITELVFVDYQPGARAALSTSAGEASLDLVASCLNFRAPRRTGGALCGQG